jgi:ABC-type oligopeptide transport system substrate-binding subunit
VESGPKLIRELSVTDTSEGLKLLAEKKILAIDRRAPWEIANQPELAEQYVVGRYATPTVHFLVPNRNRPLPSSRTFRRALLYGLNRQGIVQTLNGRANNVELISGVAPKGGSGVDPIGYGYDPQIAPRIYDPKLAVALCLMSLSHARDKNLLREDEQPKRKRAIQLASDMPEIVLAHPNNTAAQAAAQMIWRQWESIGILVKLVPYSADEPIGRGSRGDFWFVACPVSEPMFDVRVILSGDGLAGSSSVYMDLALKKLERAIEWPDIARELRAVHRLSFEETSILPLWQHKDCFLVHKDLLGVQEPPGELFHFYQNVERWKVPFVWGESCQKRPCLWP